jgi:hypothetical protein
MERRSVRHWGLVLCGALLGAWGCGGGDWSDEPSRPDLDRIGTGKSDIPGYFSYVSAPDFGCGVKHEGKFKGKDSAHAFDFELKKGMRYTFELSADYAMYKGAAVAVFDKTTGDRVALDRRVYGRSAAVTYVPPADGSYVVGAYSVKWTATGDYTLRAVCQLEAMKPRKPGQTDFESLERQHSLRWLTPQGGALETAKAAEAPTGRTGDVEEADIYKVENNRLFYLNTYRGFIVYDIKDPKQPKLISRLPVYGYPVEMFIQNNTVYALIRDALYLTQDKGKLTFKRHHVSQLVAIDIQNLAAPKVLQRVDVIGHLKEGVSRKIGDTIYVVSHQPRGYFWGWDWEQDPKDKDKEQAWVYSFNVANPKNLKLVDKLKIFEGGSYSENDPATGAYKSRTFDNLTLSATANTLMVVENWRKYGSVYGSQYQCGQSESLQQAIVSVVDISDTQGKIKLHTKFESYGAIGDQFKQTYVYDKNTAKGYYLGLFARREWQSQSCTGTSRIENNLEVWDISDGQNPKRVGKLQFGKPNETIRGSVFDPERRVAFAITAENVDPLYALSFATPSQPKVLSEVDGLSGDMNVFRFIADRNFLIGIGQDNSSTCTGFGSPTTGWSSNVAVSIIDVKNLDKIRLVQRACVTVTDASWVGSQVNWNLDQAHKMLGMHSDGVKNIISVPVYYTKKQPAGSWFWYRRETAVGLMSWDLTKYDPQKDHLNQDVLANHGTVIHADGEVRRSVVFTHKGVSSRRKMINLSNTHMAVVDIEDLDKPQSDSQVEIAPYSGGLFRFGGYMVERIGRSWDQERPTEFRVKKVGANLDQAAAVAKFTVNGQVQQALPVGDNLVIFRRTRNAQTNKWTTDAVVYGLKNPTKPQELATVKLPLSYVPYYRYRCGVPSYTFGGSSSLVVSGNVIAMLKHEYSSQLQQSTTSMLFVDLSAPTNPAITEEKLPTKKDRTYLDLVVDSTKGALYLNYREKVGELKVDQVTFDRVKYYSQRWKKSYAGWTGDKGTNIPGQLIKSWSAWGKQILTYDKTYDMLKDGGWRESTRLNLLMPTFSSGPQGPKAILFDSHTFTGYFIKDLVLDGSTLYINAREQYTFSPGPVPLGGWMPYKPSPDELSIFKINFFKLQKVFSESLGTEYVELMGTHQGHLFLNMPSDGILAVNVTNPAKPYGEHFLRTVGYATQVEFAGNTAYVPAGHYGIYELDLSGGAKLTLE